MITFQNFLAYKDYVGLLTKEEMIALGLPCEEDGTLGAKYLKSLRNMCKCYENKYHIVSVVKKNMGEVYQVTYYNRIQAGNGVNYLLAKKDSINAECELLYPTTV